MSNNSASASTGGGGNKPAAGEHGAGVHGPESAEELDEFIDAAKSQLEELKRSRTEAQRKLQGILDERDLSPAEVKKRVEELNDVPDNYEPSYKCEREFINICKQMHKLELELAEAKRKRERLHEFSSASVADVMVMLVNMIMMK